MSDVFREVNEDLRREQLKRLWSRYGIYIIGAAVLIVFVVAGYQVLQSIAASRSAESGDRYQAAATLYLDGDLAGAEAAFDALTEDGYGGYQALALMGVGAIRSELGDINGAITAFDTVAGDPGVEPALREVAQIRAGMLLSDTLTPDQMAERMAPLVESGNPYRTLALEAMVLTAINAEDFDRAMGWLIDMVEDPFANESINARANILFTYIAARQPQLNPAAAQTPILPLGDAFAPVLPANPAVPGIPAGFAATPDPVEADAPGLDPIAPLQFEFPGVGAPIPLLVPDEDPAAGDGAGAFRAAE
ncbi:MAG: tetratricopeptide repeat protein [Alphaproteobacteria bacterium]